MSFDHMPGILEVQIKATPNNQGLYVRNQSAATSNYRNISDKLSGLQAWLNDRA